MAGKGGARAGSGRPTLAKELSSADLARNVLIKKYGTLEKALQYFIEQGNPRLTLFILEHAMGKSPDKIQMSANITSGPIIIEWGKQK